MGELPFAVDSRSVYWGVQLDSYPLLTAEIVGGYYWPALMRDPMDTPRQIGFLAEHAKETSE